MTDRQRKVLTGVGVLLLAGCVGFSLGANRLSADAEVVEAIPLTPSEPVLLEADRFDPMTDLLSAEDILRLNRRAVFSNAYIDIFTLTEERVESILAGCYVWPSAARACEDLSPIPAAEKAGVLANASLVDGPGYGLVLTRGSIRALPTMTKYVNPSRNPGFDRLQQSAIYPQEPVRIFGTSQDGAYYLIASDFYAGWILTEHVARVGDADLRSFLDRTNQLVVQDNKVTAVRVSADGTKEAVVLPMGTIVPLADARETAAFSDYLLEGRYHGITFDATGATAILEIGKEAGVSLSYLTLSEPAVVEQADKLLGEAYDWGGSEQGRDCSAMVRDVFSGFGLWIPRDSSPQAAYSQELGGTLGIRYDRAMTDAEKLAAIRELPAGSLLFMPGHVMMVYRSDGDRVMVIHDYVDYYEVEGSDLKRVEVMQVGVSDQAILDRNGDTYLSSIFGALSLEKDR